MGRENINMTNTQLCNMIFCWITLILYKILAYLDKEINANKMLHGFLKYIYLILHNTINDEVIKSIWKFQSIRRENINKSIHMHTKTNSLSQSHLVIILFGWKVVDSHLHSGL